MSKRYEIKRTRVGGQSAAERVLPTKAWPFVITERGNVTKTVVAIPTDGMPPIHPQAQRFADRLARLLSNQPLADTEIMIDALHEYLSHWTGQKVLIESDEDGDLWCTFYRHHDERVHTQQLDIRYDFNVELMRALTDALAALRKGEPGYDGKD